METLSFWDQQREKTKSLGRIMSHMMSRRLSKILSAWHEMLAQRAAFMDILRQGLGFSLRHSLAAGFATWHHSILLRKAFGSWWTTTDRLLRLKGLMSKMVNAAMHTAFSVWVSAAAAKVQYRIACLELMASRNKDLPRRWRFWARYALERRILENTIQIALCKNLPRCWQAWAHYAKERRDLFHTIQSRQRSGQGYAWLDCLAVSQGTRFIRIRQAPSRPGGAQGVQHTPTERPGWPARLMHALEGRGGGQLTLSPLSEKPTVWCGDEEVPA